MRIIPVPLSIMRFIQLIVLSLIALSADAKIAADDYDDDRVQRRWADYQKHPEQVITGDYPHMDCFQQAAGKHQLPLSLLLAVARGESNFDPRARSKANALGLMQILWPQTAAHLGIQRREALFDPCTNVDAGARYLRELQGRYGGDLHRTLAAYNYGPGRIPVDRDRPIPAGASWYSRYIQRHLDYVLRPDQKGGKGQGRFTLIHFSRPYRAAAFVDRIQPMLGEIRVDWFRRQSGGFDVVVEYHDQAQRRRTRRVLSELGFEL